MFSATLVVANSDTTAASFRSLSVMLPPVPSLPEASIAASR